MRNEGEWLSNKLTTSIVVYLDEIQRMLVKVIYMSRLSYQHLVSLMGLLGSALVIVGFFLPCRITTLPTYPDAIDSFWTMLADTVTSESFRLDLSPTNLAIGSFLLTILIPLLTSLAGLFGKGKRVILILSLAFAILGLLEFLIESLFLFSHFVPNPPFAAQSTTAVALGEWLMLSGFLVSIGSSIAQNVLFKPRATVIESDVGRLR